MEKIGGAALPLTPPSFEPWGAKPAPRLPYLHSYSFASRSKSSSTFISAFLIMLIESGKGGGQGGGVGEDNEPKFPHVASN